VQVPGKPARDSFLDIPVTGSLDKWVTISTSMTFDKGKYLVRFLAKGDKLTLNWMKFSKIGK
jgi:hypothetical protein